MPDDTKENAIHTPEEISDLLQKNVREKLSPEEIKAQRLSFSMGMLSEDSQTTREEMQEILDERYG